MERDRSSAGLSSVSVLLPIKTTMTVTATVTIKTAHLLVTIYVLDNTLPVSLIRNRIRVSCTG